MSVTPEPPVEVRRSARRRRTVSAYRDGETVVVLMPDSFTAAEEAQWVATMVERVRRAERRAVLSDDQLLVHALRLGDQYLGGLAVPDSVRWVGNQRSRWGSCSPGDRTIRLSERLQGRPAWVVDYVLVHELAHLIERHHTPAFWSWVHRYPLAERARGYLVGWSEATDLAPPQGSEDAGEGLDEDVV